MNNNIIYFLIFASLVGLITYVSVSMKNTQITELELFGEKKKLSVRSVVLITLLDGIMFGLLFGFLIFKGLN